jgi:hypothetical protein
VSSFVASVLEPRARRLSARLAWRLQPRAKAANIDAEILTFALNLEYLEAEFYSLAASGKKLPKPNRPPPRTDHGGISCTLLNSSSAGPRKRASDGGNKTCAVPPGRSDRGNRILCVETGYRLSEQLPKAGLGRGFGDGFQPLHERYKFPPRLFVFEDVGVTAYHGAAPLITSSVYLDKAAGILAAEAYHAGAVRMLLFNFGMASETMKIANLRATLDGTINTYRLGNQPAYLRSSASTGL